jgi:hypothetical protein
MKFYKLLTFLLLSIISLETSAQENDYKPGYIIKNNDSIPLLIQQNDVASLSKHISYKLGEKHGTYLPGEISAFGFEKDKYVFETTEVHLKTNRDSIKASTFSRVIVKGMVSLYKTSLPKDILKNVYIKGDDVYIIKKDTSSFTLWQRQEEVFIDNYFPSTEDTRYTGLARIIFQDCSTILEEDYEKLILSDISLKRLVKKYNQCRYPDKQIATYNNIKPVFKHGLEVGADVFRYMKTDFNISPYSSSIGYFVDIIEPSLSKRTSLKLGVSYSTYTLSGSPFEQDSKVHFIRYPVFWQRYLRKYDKSVVPFFNLGVNVIFDKGFPFFRKTLGAGIYINNFKFDARAQINEFERSILSFSLGYRLDKLFK